MAIGINAELRVAEIVKDSAERLAINDDLVGSFGKIRLYEWRCPKFVATALL